MISYVLMGFVAVSLIVSSIMIGIITYISVLERIKEIGILRAMGASRRDIRNVFNAETFIIGLFSGLLGIGVTILLDWPISAVVENLTGVAGIASLPWQGSLALLLINLILTMIAGLIPASIASKKNPVEALRTEYTVRFSDPNPCNKAAVFNSPLPFHFSDMLLIRLSHCLTAD